LVIIENTVQAIEVEECHWCTLCEMVCPYGAITCPFEIIMENDNQA
jgi:ferredoxin